MHAASLPAPYRCLFLYPNSEWPAFAGHWFEGVAVTVSLTGGPPRSCFINLHPIETPLKYLTSAGGVHNLRNDMRGYPVNRAKKKPAEGCRGRVRRNINAAEPAVTPGIAT